MGRLGMLACVALAGSGLFAGPAPVDGVWRTDGYRTVVSIKDGRLRTYDRTGAACLPGVLTGRSVGPGRFATGEGSVVTVRSGNWSGNWSSNDNAGHRMLTRLPALPQACTRPPRTDPRAVFDVFWRAYAENYPFFAAKGIDWTAVRAAYRPRVHPDTPPRALAHLLCSMIAPLHDAHTALDTGSGIPCHGLRPGTPEPSPALFARASAVVEQNLGVPLRRYAGGALSFALLPRGVGYLGISAFTGYGDTAAADQRILDRMLHATLGAHRLRGLIIDLRLNGGGSDALALRLAGHLTRLPYLAYAKRARNDPADASRFTTPEPIPVSPARHDVYSGPIRLLTGSLTLSAGETFTQALLGRSPAPVRIGAATQGVFSDELERRLPNGWVASLPNEEYLTAAGSTFDGAGIPPHLRTPVFSRAELAAGRDSALAAARRGLA